MSHVDEEWVKAAIADDTMVVELLVQLHRASPPLKPAALKLDWSVRQRRSKSVSINKKPAHRASPTTPLSWSCLTSVSGGSGGAGGGGFEESSRPPSLKISNNTRSKVNGDGEKTSSKRSRKKKTIAQLIEEEKYLVKERRDLNKEIVALRLNLEKQRSTRKSLKKMKFEFQPYLDKQAYSFSLEESVSLHPLCDEIMQSNVSGIDISLLPSTSNGCLKQNTEISFDTKFILPDLNMPFEESNCDVC